MLKDEGVMQNSQLTRKLHGLWGGKPPPRGDCVVASIDLQTIRETVRISTTEEGQTGHP